MLLYAVVLAISLYFYHPLWFVLTMLTLFVLGCVEKWRSESETRRREEKHDADPQDKPRNIEDGSYLLSS